jgi:hypothetical protein
LLDILGNVLIISKTMNDILNLLDNILCNYFSNKFLVEIEHSADVVDTGSIASIDIKPEMFG